jgi:amidohydrolase
MKDALLQLIEQEVDSLEGRIIGVRREIHRRPELSCHEALTSAFVANALEEAGIETRRNVGGHGVIGIIRGKAGAYAADRKVFALRADMDALPIEEANDCEYKSRVPGVMHACGHDAHTAMLMGAGLALNSLKERLSGDVKLIFQPSEEKGSTGASLMIADGALDDPRPSAIFALHCFPEIETGNVGHRPGVMTAAADQIRITVIGKGGHASRPHQTVDAVLMASLAVNAVHHIVSRRTDPMGHAVISIGSIRGGSAANIIADRVVMEGTIRTFDEDLRDTLPKMIEEAVRGVTSGMGGAYEFEHSHGTPSVINDAMLDAFVRDAAIDILGRERVREMDAPVMGAEDFAWYAEKIPGALLRLGTSNRSKGIEATLHSPSFDIDEDALAIGSKVMCWVAAKYLNAHCPA